MFLRIKKQSDKRMEVFEGKPVDHLLKRTRSKIVAVEGASRNETVYPHEESQVWTKAV